jgi:hypothetical protein
MNDESRLHSPDALNTATPRKHLPEDSDRTLGPGHIDMVHERISQAIGIAQMMHAAIHNRGNLMEGAEDAAWGQQRLLEEAVEHLSEYTRERAEDARREAARQPLHQNALTAAVIRLKRLEGSIANHAPEKEDLELLADSIALLEGRSVKGVDSEGLDEAQRLLVEADAGLAALWDENLAKNVQLKLHNVRSQIKRAEQIVRERAS